MRNAALFVSLSMLPAPGAAHHSIAALYDYADIREITGTITNVAWINPHIHLTMDTVAADGAAQTWALEASAINMLQRNGITRDLIAVGDRITAIGPVARDGRPAMAAAVAVLPNGDRVALFTLIASRLGLDDSDGGQAFQAPPATAADAAAAAGRGIYKVWTPRSRPVTGDGRFVWPLTAAARAAIEAYDPLTDDPALKCVQAGMPVILDTPFPVEFAMAGTDIVVGYEEWDGVRRIHMNPLAATGRTPMGHSLGRWNGDTLEVTTTHIDYPYFDDGGTPQSEQLVVAERYTLSDSGRRLDWQATFTDPLVFTEPVVFTGHMAWVAGEEVKPFNCTLPP